MERIVSSDKPLPELADYLSTYDRYFVRSEGRENLERYSTGLLSDIPRKNGVTIEDNVPGTNNQRLQSLLTGSIKNRCFSLHRISKKPVFYSTYLSNGGEGR